MVLIHSSVNLDQCHLGTRKMQVFLGNQNHARQIIDVYVLKRPSFSYVKEAVSHALRMLNSLKSVQPNKKSNWRESSQIK